MIERIIDISHFVDSLAYQSYDCKYSYDYIIIMFIIETNLELLFDFGKQYFDISVIDAFHLEINVF